MKIIIVSYWHPDSGLTLAKHLSSKVDLTFLLVVYGDRYQQGLLNLDLRKIPYGLTIDKDIISNLLPPEINSYINNSFKLYILRMPSLKILRDWRGQNIKLCFRAARYIRNNNFDVVHFNGTSGFQFYFHFFLLRKPKVYTIHDYIPHSGVEKKSPILINRILTKLSYQFILHSKKLCSEFIKFYKVSPKRVNAIYNGPLDIYTAYKKEETKESFFTVLFFGKISKYKGISYLIKASEDIKKVVPEIKIIIAGKGDLGIDKDKLDKKVFIIDNDYIDMHTLAKYIQKSNVVVLPYIDATQSAVLMAAYAFNKPVVATNVGGIPELVDDSVTGILVPPRNSQKLAEAIIYFLKNPDKRKEISENIQRKFSDGEFGWDVITEKLIDVYKKAIKNQ